MMTPLRFAGAFSLVLYTLLSAESASASSFKDLTDAAENAVKSNPKLRAADSKRKMRLLRDFASVSPTSRVLEEGNNDDYNSYYKYSYDADMSNSDFGFDVDSYSFKYTGCSTVQTYSDELSYYGEDDILAAKRFATFRLCPQRTCSDNNYEGCSSNYGDYVVSMDQFLAAMVSLNEDRVIGYCEYCEECAAIESFHKFYYETVSQKTAVVSMAEATYQTWLSNYYESQGYNANAEDGYDGGDNADNGGGYNGYDQSAALQYYQSIQNSANYANDYTSNYGYNGNSNGGGYGGGYNGGNGGGSYSQWANSQQFWSGSQNTNSQNGWSDMGQSYGSWYGKQIVNGHYYDGEFVTEWGYFRDDGAFISLEEESVEWDEYLYGEYPDTWDEDWIGGAADDVQSCNYKYSASCSNQYESCMRITENEDYMAYQEYQQQVNGGQAMTNSLADFVACTQVDQDYIDQYQQYQQWESQMDAQYQQQNGQQVQCNADDDACAAQYQQQQNDNANNNNDAYQYANMNLYIGPHCGDDGRTISLAVYTDAVCSNHASQYSVKDILGVDVMQEHTGGNIDLFPEKCISCVSDEQDMWYEDEQVDGYDDGISPLCSMLYQYAGKCHQNLQMTSSYNSNQYYDQSYQSEAQQENEQQVCNFIDAVRSNTYNENGQVTFGYTNIFSSNGFRSGARAMGAGHKAALWILGLGLGALLVSAVYIQRQLNERNISWRPRRFARGSTNGANETFIPRSDGADGYLA